jgi:hypothetical protein
MQPEIPVWRLVLAFALLAGLLPIGTSSAQDVGHRVELIKPLTPELRAIAEAYYLNDPETVRFFRVVVKRPIPLDELEGAFADIDDDGQPEAFIRESNAFGHCGSIGCQVLVFKKAGNEWHVLGAFPDTLSEIAILLEKDHGIHRIWFYGDYKNKPGAIIWDGKEFH